VNEDVAAPWGLPDLATPSPADIFGEARTANGIQAIGLDGMPSENASAQRAEQTLEGILSRLLAARLLEIYFSHVSSRGSEG
jgi:hypothetical protein